MATATPHVSRHFLTYQDASQEYAFPLESPEWWEWLDREGSRVFRFTGLQGRFTARRENKHGKWYWYAYRKYCGLLVKAYLGKSEELNEQRLEMVAQIINDRCHTPRGQSAKALLLRDQTTGLPPRSRRESSQKCLPLRATPGSYVEAPQNFHFSLKCTPGPLQERFVSRPRLIERLNKATESLVTLVSAPAGSGKSTLLRSWYFATLERKSLVAWVSLDAGDNDPSRFWVAVITALQTVAPSLGVQALWTLQMPRVSSLEGTVASLLQDLASYPSPVTLVLDDYHLIESPRVHETITLLLDRMPPLAHLLLATRADPSLPLARWRAQGHIAEIRAPELAFTSEEATDFFHDTMNLLLSADDITALMYRTEGWIAGLQLAALSLQGQEVGPFLNIFAGNAGYMIDYLGEEVLNRQSEQTQQFLLATSLLERLTGSLCDALFERRGSYALLQSLERANIFLIPLDSEHQWYRYHHLFAEFLRIRLSQTENDEQIVAWHLKAAHWYEQYGFLEDALHHLLAARHFPEAAQVLERFCEQLMKSGKIITLLRWLQALPEEHVRLRPYLSLYYAGALLSTEQLDEAERHLQDAEQAIHSMSVQEPAGAITDGSGTDLSEMQGLLDALAVTRASLAGFRGDVAQTMELSRQARSRLPKNNAYLESVLAASLGMAYLLGGDLTRASETFLAAETIGATAHHFHLSLASASAHAYLLMEQGHLHQAAERYRQILCLATEEGPQLTALSTAYLGLGELHYYWNEMDLAERSLHRGLHGEQRWEPITVLARGSLFLARIQQARGERANAFEGIQELEKQALRLHLRRFLPYIGAIRATLWLAEGNVEEASRWMQGSGLRVDDELNHLYEFPYLILAQVLAHTGTSGEANLLLSRLLTHAETEARMRSVVNILVCQASVFHLQGNNDQAQQALLRALSLAEPEGWIRVFIDQGASMRTLLSAILAGRVKKPSAFSSLLPYVNTLLAAIEQEQPEPLFPYHSSSHHQGSVCLVSLTTREREVLHLVALGLSNQHIARELVVAVSTVKWHLKQISLKLVVHSRIQMVARARELHLL